MKRSLALAALASLAAWACGEAPSVYGPGDGDVILSVDLVDNQWTYVSLGEGCVVGRSPLGDAVADSAWARRLDWDVALCNGQIRTNGGTSGHGRGGMALAPDGYEQTDAARAVPLQSDTVVQLTMND